jgi:hypothetical protein
MEVITGKGYNERIIKAAEKERLIKYNLRGNHE